MSGKTEKTASRTLSRNASKKIRRRSGDCDVLKSRMNLRRLLPEATVNFSCQLAGPSMLDPLQRASITCQHKAFSVSPLLVAFQAVTPW